jgi:hypothetical protein
VIAHTITVTQKTVEEGIPGALMQRMIAALVEVEFMRISF